MRSIWRSPQNESNPIEEEQAGPRSDPQISVRGLCDCPWGTAKDSVLDSPGGMCILRDVASRIDCPDREGSSGFLVGKHRPVPGHDAQACRSERAHSFIAERFSERPGAVKAALGAAKRSLDGEDRSGTIPRQGMARWTVVSAPISFTHYKPGIPRKRSSKRTKTRRQRMFNLFVCGPESARHFASGFMAILLLAEDNTSRNH
jgi:hypothetical protein